jgi:hypothetical protein
LEFGCPLRVGDLKAFVSPFGFLLASCQVTMLEEFPGMVILNLSAVGAAVLQRNQQ